MLLLCVVRRRTIVAAETQAIWSELDPPVRDEITVPNKKAHDDVTITVVFRFISIPLCLSPDLFVCGMKAIKIEFLKNYEKLRVIREARGAEMQM